MSQALQNLRSDKTSILDSVTLIINTTFKSFGKLIVNSYMLIIRWSSQCKTYDQAQDYNLTNRNDCKINR